MKRRNGKRPASAACVTHYSRGSAMEKKKKVRFVFTGFGAEFQ
jgi:hypothetical protein